MWYVVSQILSRLGKKLDFLQMVTFGPKVPKMPTQSMMEVISKYGSLNARRKFEY